MYLKFDVTRTPPTPQQMKLECCKIILIIVAKLSLPALAIWSATAPVQVYAAWFTLVFFVPFWCNGEVEQLLQHETLPRMASDTTLIDSLATVSQLKKYGMTCEAYKLECFCKALQAQRRALTLSEYEALLVATMNVESCTELLEAQQSKQPAAKPADVAVGCHDTTEDKPVFGLANS